MAVPSAASYRAIPGLHRAIGGSAAQNVHGREHSEDYEHPMNIEVPTFWLYDSTDIL